MEIQPRIESENERAIRMSREKLIAYSEMVEQAKEAVRDAESALYSRTQQLSKVAGETPADVWETLDDEDRSEILNNTRIILPRSGEL
jgi:uncharacterized protein YlxW (UPF0749 family)